MRDLIRANLGLLLAGVATFVLLGAGQSLLGPALPAFSRSFGVTTGQAGILVSALWVGSACGIALMYFQGARVTPRHALVLVSLGAAIMATMAAWGLMVVGAVVLGTGSGISAAVFNPRILRAFEDRGPSMLSLLNASFGVGAIIAPLVFVAVGNDPHWSFGLLAAAAACLWLLTGGAGQVGTTEARVAKVAFRPRWLILGFGTLAIGLEATLIGLGPTALIRAGESETRAAELLSAFFIAFLAARIVLIFTAHLIPSFALFIAAMVGTCLLAGAATVFDPAWPFIGIGAFASLFFPSFYVTATRLMGDDLRVPPTIIASGLVGGITFPFLIAPGLVGMGERGLFALVAGLTLVSALMALASLRWMRT